MMKRFGQTFYCSLVVVAWAVHSANSGIAGEIQDSGSRPEEPRRPNIVFLYTDDQARWGLGAYGNREIKTPHLDHLARSGAIFRNAFTVTPVCSPSRAALMTSLYPSELGIFDWIDPTKEPELGLAPSAITWPELLKGSGYAAMLAGKWHLGTRDEYHPTRQGFDKFFGFRDGSNRPIDPMLEVDGKARQLTGSLPDLLVDEGVKFIEQHRKGPLLLSIHFRAPHTPYAPVPDVDSAPYRGLDPTIPNFPGLPTERVKQLYREYYASVSSVDRNVGRLLAKLDELELSSRTIVIFTSDHGYMIGQHGLWHKGNAAWLAEGKTGYRPNMFDDSIRVPLLIRWPGVVVPGTSIERIVSNLDLLPTILDMAGPGAPANLQIRGRSLAPLLRGQNSTWDDTLFGQYDMHHYQVARMRMIRTPDWKLVRHFERGGRDELYHLKRDPGETGDLIDHGETSTRSVREELRARLERWMTGIGDRSTVSLRQPGSTRGFSGEPRLSSLFQNRLGVKNK
jgi:choline-sulfatase